MSQVPWRYTKTTGSKITPGKAVMILFTGFVIGIMILMGLVFGAIQFIKWAIEF